MPTAESKLEGADAAEKIRPIRIGLLWHSLSSGNLGVGALTLANMALATQVAQDMGLSPQFLVMSMRDGHVVPICGPDVALCGIDTRQLFSPDGFWRAVGGIDCVLDIGAGDSFADIYGPKRFLFLWLTKMIAIARRKPLLLSPQTIGPFTRPIYRWLGAIAMRHATGVVARDEMSRQVASEMAPSAQVTLAVDVAFVLPFTRPGKGARSDGALLRVGVNASGLLFHEAETGRNRFGLSYDYAAFTRKLIAALLARGAEVHLVPHATSPIDPTDDDGRLADRLASEFPGVVRVTGFPGPIEAKSYIAGLEFLVAGRMHACIGAYSAGVPVVPVAYSRKFSGLFGMLHHDIMVPVSGMDEDMAVAYVLNALDRRDAIASSQRGGMARIDAKLDVYRDELRRTFALALGRSGGGAGANALHLEMAHAGR